MIPSLIKKPLRKIRDFHRGRKIEQYLDLRSRAIGPIALGQPEIDEVKERIRKFIQSMQTDNSGVHYRYSNACAKPTLYSSAYACMTLSILGALELCSEDKRRDWVDYFDSFQSDVDGLFYDSAVMNENFSDTDWWGARHLALHMVSAYTDLGARPKNPFKFLDQYYDIAKNRDWLDGFSWETEAFDHSNDIDNKLMNVGCLLQYQRDFFGDDGAGAAVSFFKDYLKRKINKETGMWGAYAADDPAQRSRMVQFAYHLLPLFFYDNDFDFDVDLLVENILRTQNRYGGFGVSCNSSACEDIDSIDVLVRLRPFSSGALKVKIDDVLERALHWVLLNQVADGGFVFRLNEKMRYGHDEMRSEADAGAMFPTWFRTLSLAFLFSRHKEVNFLLNPVPGYVVRLHD
jgi:hypothetical protein